MIYRFFRFFLFAFSAETAHRLTLGSLRLLSYVPGVLWLLRALFGVSDPRLRLRALGLDLASPVGLAAGLDKDAEVFEAFGALGFGFVEIGTVTSLAQPGNPQPRLFRLRRDRALLNRMGFNNHGAAAAAARLARPRRTLVGANIGRSKVTPNEAAVADYVTSAELLAPHADYMVVNVSSPNTPSLRELQAVESLRPLISGVQQAIERAAPGRAVPLLLKVAPDLHDDDIDAIADLALELRIAGIIATNTTIGRGGLQTPPSEVEALGSGGLSGAPLKERSLQVLRRLRRRVGDRLLLVGAGGIETAEDAWDRIRAGATLVQVYSALVYDGPSLPSRIASGLAERVSRAGLSNISGAIGTDA
ncbi:MAG: quinone-dependent dihydroorotate dehydrogenase [Myxococcales bacterium]|nr:MAG: quinone-dependent dihydroorotate dehydrogenase [Myxococcales bacterium]